MKKLLFTVFLSLTVVLAFAQKKALKSAKSELTAKNIDGARAQIKGALEDPETKDLAETWYVASQIENKAFDLQKANEALGQAVNYDVMYNALVAIIPYLDKAAELDQLPDEKGKVKPKYLKDIRAIYRDSRPFYGNAGTYFSEKKEYQKAYDCFKVFGDIPNKPIFNEDKFVVLDTDTILMQVKYYAGIMATGIPNHEAAIAVFNEIKEAGLVLEEFDVYYALCVEYQKINDTINFDKTVLEGFKKFPDNNFYVLNLINASIRKSDFTDAISYLDAALVLNPKQAQLYDVLGQVYEAQKDFDKAILNMKKANELNPDTIDFQIHLGRVYYNWGIEVRSNADDIKDEALSKAELQKAKDYFREAMPLFEAVFAKDENNFDAIKALRSIYYALTMTDEYEKMELLYNKLSGGQ
jgi:tetratricopeptide (TPR) repeat protein